MLSWQRRRTANDYTNYLYFEIHVYMYTKTHCVIRKTAFTISFKLWRCISKFQAWFISDFKHAPELRIFSAEIKRRNRIILKFNFNMSLWERRHHCNVMFISPCKPLLDFLLYSSPLASNKENSFTKEIYFV